MSDDAVKSGFIHKCGNSVKSWKKRWFVLKPNGYLYYYETPDCKKEKGKIDVVDSERIAMWQEVSTADKIPSNLSSVNAFAIVTAARTYTCVCDSQEEARSWIAVLNKARDGTEQQYPPATYPKKESTSTTPASEGQAPPTMDAPPSYDATMATPLPYPGGGGGGGMPMPAPQYTDGPGAQQQNVNLSVPPPAQPYQHSPASPRHNSYCAPPSPQHPHLSPPTQGQPYASNTLPRAHALGQPVATAGYQGAPAPPRPTYPQGQYPPQAAPPGAPPYYAQQQQQQPARPLYSQPPPPAPAAYYPPQGPPQRPPYYPPQASPQRPPYYPPQASPQRPPYRPPYYPPQASPRPAYQPQPAYAPRPAYYPPQQRAYTMPPPAPQRPVVAQQQNSVNVTVVNIPAPARPVNKIVYR